MRDPAVALVDIGVSEDNPAAPALVLHLSSTPTMPAPVQIECVRTKLVFDFTALLQQNLPAQIYKESPRFGLSTRLNLCRVLRYLASALAQARTAQGKPRW
jgi:hypothetical protein